MNKSLVIMAAGMASRFGGNKQSTVVGPSGEVLADYAVYNAVRCGFKRVVFIIREEAVDIFDEITKKFKDRIEVCYAFQKLTDVPSDVVIPETRVKMWGTTHALLAAEKFIDGPFLLINADDFNDYEAFKYVNDFFESNTNENDYISVNYEFGATKSKTGEAVKRAVAMLDGKKILDLMESSIGEEDGKLIARSLNTDAVLEVDETTPVSVNFFGLKPSVFKYLHEDFDEFIHGELTDTCECLLPFTLKAKIKDGTINMYQEVAKSPWFGLTYKEDLPDVQNRINKMIEEGKYPNNLWG